jgi:hypothetical protein
LSDRLNRNGRPWADDPFAEHVALNGGLSDIAMAFGRDSLGVPTGPPPKSTVTAIILCLFVAPLAFHRWYLNFPGVALMQMGLWLPGIYLLRDYGSDWGLLPIGCAMLWDLIDLVCMPWLVRSANMR